MSNVAYVSLSRQSALASELTSIANNIANADTTGFRKDAFIFSEYVNALQGEPSLSQTRIGGRLIDQSEGELIATGGALDLAIEGSGFFAVETPQGRRLTRAGDFSVNEQGVISTSEGFALAGEGGAPIAVPSGAERIVVAPDGVVTADGAPVGRIEIVDADPTALRRVGDTLFAAEGELRPIENPAIRQGYVEGSNVNAVIEMSRLIEVQRAFEIGQQMLNDDAERTRRAIETLSGAR
ncbi:MAG: flagellar basal-body rod protein FlgF [Pseudomonadota bacterium]